MVPKITKMGPSLGVIRVFFCHKEVGSMSRGTYSADSLDEKAHLRSLNPSLRTPPELVRRVIRILERGTQYQAIQELRGEVSRGTIKKIHTHWAAGRLVLFTPQGQRPLLLRRIECIFREERERHPGQKINIPKFATLRGVEVQYLREVCRSWEKSKALVFTGDDEVQFLIEVVVERELCT
jgi:hypothetical protein